MFIIYSQINILTPDFCDWFLLQLMQKEHLHLSREAHACADSIPDLNNMISAVQGLGMLVNFFFSQVKFELWLLYGLT